MTVFTFACVFFNLMTDFKKGGGNNIPTFKLDKFRCKFVYITRYLHQLETIRVGGKFTVKGKKIIFKVILRKYLRHL